MKKSILLGVSVILLVLGMAVVGCDDSSTEDSTGFIDEPLPVPIGDNALSGKIFYKRYDKITFSVTTGGAVNGTYEKSTVADGRYGPADKFNDYLVIETGIYTWNEEAKTVTLKPEKVAGQFAGYDILEVEVIEIQSAYTSLLMNAAETRAFYQTLYEEDREEMGNAAFNEELNFLMNDIFGNTTNRYSFSTGNTALFLDKVLPANKGTNELSGQTYYGTSWDYNYETGETSRVKDMNKTYVFTASGFTNTLFGSITTGSYAYDSTAKNVWFKEETVDGKNKAAIFAEPAPFVHRYIDDNAYCAAQANEAFHLRVISYEYKTSDKTIN